MGLTTCSLNDHEEAVRRTLNYAVQLIRQEFENFLRGREEARERYYAIMSFCRFGCRWSDVKRMLAVKEGYEANDKKVTELLQNLVDASFLTKENDLYKPSDPLIARTF